MAAGGLMLALIPYLMALLDVMGWRGWEQDQRLAVIRAAAQGRLAVA